MPKKKSKYTAFSKKKLSTPYEEETINQFIQEYYPYSNAIIGSICIPKYGYDIVKSAAYEGVWMAFNYICEKKIKEEKHIKGIISKISKSAYWNICMSFGFVRSRGQIYFPTSYVPFEEYFRDRSIESNVHRNIDAKIINDLIERFPQKEITIHQMYQAGYDFTEISRVVGTNRHSVGKLYKRSVERLKKFIKNPIKTCLVCKKEFQSDIRNDMNGFCSKTCSRKSAWTKQNNKRNLNE